MLEKSQLVPESEEYAAAGMELRRNRRAYKEQLFNERVLTVAVDWDVKIGETFPVRLVVYGTDRTSLLADIAKAIAATAVNIRSAGMATEDRTARGMFVVEVPHLSKLYEVMTAIPLS